MKNNSMRYFFGAGLMLAAISYPTFPLQANTQTGVLKNTIEAVTWSSTVTGASAPSGEVLECASTPCDRFDLNVNLPGGVWNQKPGGVEIAIRWPIAAFGDNLFLYVYKDGARIAKSDGVIASAQSVIIPQAANGLYTIYAAYDQLDPNNPQDFGSARK